MEPANDYFPKMKKERSLHAVKIIPLQLKKK